MILQVLPPVNVYLDHVAVSLGTCDRLPRARPAPTMGPPFEMRCSMTPRFPWGRTFLLGFGFFGISMI
ncbi:MAG: hypothetical protein NTU91_15465 [Chloroflexi bacterium]|nr:hypothetical protein [Chloroflexota bacterium]